jgi:hypothetical protein
MSAVPKPPNPMPLRRRAAISGAMFATVSIRPLRPSKAESATPSSPTRIRLDAAPATPAVAGPLAAKFCITARAVRVTALVAVLDIDRLFIVAAIWVTVDDETGWTMAGWTGVGDGAAVGVPDVVPVVDAVPGAAGAAQRGAGMLGRLRNTPAIRSTREAIRFQVLSVTCEDRRNRSVSETRLRMSPTDALSVES